MILATTLPAPAWANPEGGVVTEGRATIQAGTPGRLDIIQTTPKAVIDWQRFGIREGEHTDFRQPDAGSIALNRVVGSDPSAIMGRLTANGQLWLVNPNGILFGPNARVDVGGLIATTHDIRNDDFMAGRYRFDGRAGSTATVENEGAITVAQAGLAALVAPGVSNRGTITARLGEVTLASGRRFVVDLFGDQKINLAVDAKTDARPVGSNGKPVEALVENKGKVFADGGRVQMTASAAKGLVDRVVNMSGTVQARRVEQQGGDIVLLGEGGDVEVSGTLDAAGSGQGQTGGSVTVSGNRTALTATAKVHASGAAGGGEVLVGGDVQGGRASSATLAGYTIRPARKPVPPSTVTVVADGATIDADATGSGKGGKVVVWADERTRFDGAISARGGAAGGDGGFVETSGKLSLHVRGTVDARAGGAGKSGSWLLDPTEVTITSGAADTIFGGLYESSSEDGSITAATVESALNAGTDVTIQTVKDTSGSGDIIVDSQIRKTAGADATLTLKAYRNVLVNADITSTVGRLNLDLQSNVDVVSEPGTERDADGGVVWFQGGPGAVVSVETNGGYLRIGGARYVSNDPEYPYSMDWPAQGLSEPDEPSGTSYRHGVQLTYTTISTNGGAIDINGQGGAFEGGTNYGIHLSHSQLAAGTGSIALVGKGGSDWEIPVYVDNSGIVLSNSTISTTTGAITLTGSSMSGSPDANPAIRLTDVAIDSLASGSISLIGLEKDIQLTDTTISSATGSVSITGTADANITISNSISPPPKPTIEAGGPVIVAAGAELELDQATITSHQGAALAAGYNIALTSVALTGDHGVILAAGDDIAMTDGTTITSGGPVTLASDADRDGFYNGAILLADSTITTRGGAITLGGGTDPSTDAAKGNWMSFAGVTLENSTVSSGGGAITIMGEGAEPEEEGGERPGLRTEYSGQGYGVAITGNTAIDAGTGKVAIRGKAVSQQGVTAGVLMASTADEPLSVKAGSADADAIRIDGDASQAGSEEAWGVHIAGSASLTSVGGIILSGKAGNAAANAAAGIGLDAGDTDTITLAASAGQVVLQGEAGTGGASTGVHRVGNVTVANAPPSVPQSPPPPPPPPPPPVMPPVTPPVTPSVPVSPPSPPVAPEVPVSPPPPPSPPVADGSTGSTPTGGTAQQLAANQSVQAALQTVAQVSAMTLTTTSTSTSPGGAAPAGTDTTGSAPATQGAGASVQGFLTALDQGSRQTASNQTAANQPSNGPTSPPPQPPGPVTVVLPSGRSVSYSAAATEAHASGATLWQPSPQLLASPQVQAAAGSLIQAAGNGGMVQAVTTLATGGLSLGEQRAVLASVPVPTLISGLAASSDPVAVRVGGILQNTAAGRPSGYAEVRATVTQANLPPPVARAYLAMVQRVEREQRTQTLSSALRQLVANPAAADMFGRPNVTSAVPSLRQARGARTRGGTMTLRGIVADSTNLAEARVNGRWVFIDDQGQFRTSIPIDPGATEATLTLTDEDGKTTEKQIKVDPAAAADRSAPPKPRKIALMIAVDNYRDGAIPALTTPDADIRAVGQALSQHLGYETRVLRNPTKAEIGDALRRLGREVKEQDQVMVYYAGHGYELAETGTGYWLPADAETTSARNWVSNNDVGRFLSRMPAKHVMVVSDSCYSGAFTKEQKVDAARLGSEEDIRQRRSVMALSSGGDEPVADGEVNSPFASALVKRVTALPRDSNGFALYGQIRDDVTAEAPQTPQYGVIKAAGYDEGGDFLLDVPAPVVN